MKLYEALARSFVAEDVETLFTLMGDANMHWSIAMADAGVRVVHTNHESGAVAMARGYAEATGRLGVASMTCGPGTAQTAISLTAGARAGVPMLVFAGDTPQRSRYHLQQFDVATFVASTGAGHVRMVDVDNALEALQHAFAMARAERRPVVFSSPYDLQNDPYPWDWFYVPSTEIGIHSQRVNPDPLMVERAAEMISASERPVIVAGRGAVASGAREAVLELGEKAGALLTTSLKAKGWFEDEPFDAGIAGSFASTVSRRYLTRADLVVAVGAGMGYFTTEGGYLFPDAKVIHIDLNPKPIHEALPVADLHVIGDAKATCEAIISALDSRGHSVRGWRSAETRAALADQSHSEPAVELKAGTLDPREAMRAIDRAIPKDWIVVIGAGHMWNFAVEYLTGRSPESYIYTIDFGTVGQALAVAIGAAVGRKDRGVALIEGDGGLLMHIQEIDTIRRYQVPIVAFILNDGGYGAEAHKLVAQGVDPSEAYFGERDIAAASIGLGLPATRLSASTNDLDDEIAGKLTDSPSHLFDVRISPNVPSAQFRRLHFGETT